MSTKYTNLTYVELMELAPKDKPFQVVVQSNPFGEGGKQTLWATNCCNYLNTFLLLQGDISNVDYAFNTMWENEYKGTFDLIIHHLDDTTLETFQVGDEVEILDNIMENYPTNKSLNVKIPIGPKIECKNLFRIKSIYESTSGNISYRLCTGQYIDIELSHNCLRKVVNKKPEPKTITIGDKTYVVTEELTNALKNLKPINEK